MFIYYLIAIDVSIMILILIYYIFNCHPTLTILIISIPVYNTIYIYYILSYMIYNLDNLVYIISHTFDFPTFSITPLPLYINIVSHKFLNETLLL